MCKGHTGHIDVCAEISRIKRKTQQNAYLIVSPVGFEAG